MQKINTPVILLGIVGAAFMVPKSVAGLESFGYSTLPAIACACFLSWTMAQSAGIARLTRHPLAFVWLVLSFTATVATDTVADRGMLAQSNDAPVAVAAAKVERINTRLADRLNLVRELIQSANTLDNDGVSANDWEVVAKRRDAATLEVEIMDLRAELEAAQDDLVTAQKTAHFLSGKDWGEWALLGFNSVCEALLCLVGFFAVTPRKRPDQLELIEPATELAAKDLALQVYRQPTLEQVRKMEREARALRKVYNAAMV